MPRTLRERENRKEGDIEGEQEKENRREGVKMRAWTGFDEEAERWK